MGERVIVYVEFGSLMCAVERRDHPELSGLPLAISNTSLGEVFGVVAGVSAEAYAQGVREGQSLDYARQQCPNLAILPGRYDAYRRVWRLAHQIFMEHTDCFETIQMDEAFLDLTGRVADLEEGRTTALSIKMRMAAELQLTATIGVASNKFLAKAAAKSIEAGGQCTVRPNFQKDFIRRLHIDCFWPLPQEAREKLKSQGYIKGAQLLELSLAVKADIIGVQAPLLEALLHGRDNTPVRPSRLQGTMTVEHLFAKASCDHHVLAYETALLLEELYERMENNSFEGSLLHIKVVYDDTGHAEWRQGLPPELSDEDLEGFSLMLAGMMSPEGRPVSEISLTATQPKQQMVKIATKPIQLTLDF